MKTPIYIIEETKLRRNLALIQQVARQTDAEFILAFKAFALWKTFPIFREYISSTTASSLSEAKLALQEFGNKAHTFSPAYTDGEFDEIVSCSSHLTFNSLSQYERFHHRATSCSVGLRINPEYSEVGTLLYNPCAPGMQRPAPWAFASIQNIPRWAPCSIIPVHQAPVSVSLARNFPSNCLPILKVSIVIAIVRVGQMSLRAPSVI